MSELISGKEAKSTWANGIPLEYTSDTLGDWFDVNNSNTLGIFERSDFKFRLKPSTIYLNGVEVPAPFEPKEDEMYWIISDDYHNGYTSSRNPGVTIAAWRTEEEIKQVVAALRSIFNPQ